MVKMEEKRGQEELDFMKPKFIDLTCGLNNLNKK